MPNPLLILQAIILWLSLRYLAIPLFQPFLKQGEEDFFLHIIGKSQLSSLERFLIFGTGIALIVALQLLKEIIRYYF